MLNNFQIIALQILTNKPDIIMLNEGTQTEMIENACKFADLFISITEGKNDF